MRRSVVTGLCLLLAVAAPASAQARVGRFEIAAVADTTFEFRSASASWLRPGMSGTVVDPRRRDALVARFRVIAAQTGRATALITGQVTAISTDHVVLLEEPRRSFWRQRLFWFGAAIGAAVGLAAGLVGSP